MHNHSFWYRLWCWGVALRGKISWCDTADVRYIESQFCGKIEGILVERIGSLKFLGKSRLYSQQPIIIVGNKLDIVDTQTEFDDEE